MANGIAGLRPFPTFDNKTGGIMPVNLAPSPVRFPNPRAINIAPAREDINPLAYLAPVGLSFLADKFFTPKTTIPETLSQEQQSDLSDVQLADYLTSQVYGKQPTQTTGQRIGEMFTQFGPALFADNDKELAAFMTTASTFDKARTDRDARIDTARKQYKTQLLDKMTPKNMTFVDLVEFDKTGDLVKSVRKGFLQGRPEIDRYSYTVEIDGGYFDTESKKAQTYAGNESSNFVPLEFLDKIKGFPRGSTKDETNLDDFYKTQVSKENALLDVYGTVGEIVPILRKQAEGETTGGIGAGGQMTSIINKGFNNATSTLNAIATLSGYDNPFSTDEEGGIYERGTGKNANVIHSLLVRQSEGEDVDDELNKAIGIFEKDTGFKFKRERGDVYTIQYNANMLKLAYTAAAAAGQTGRTLSDKDLAFFLEMVGYGKATSPTGQLKYLTNFVSTLTREIENTIDSQFGVDGRAIKTVYGSSLGNPKIQGIINNYYNTALNGQPIVLDRNTPADTYLNMDYIRVPFLTRYGAQDVNNQFIQPSIRKYFEALANSGVELEEDDVLTVPGAAEMQNLFN